MIQYSVYFLGHSGTGVGSVNRSVTAFLQAHVSDVFSLYTVRSMKLKEDILSCTFAELSLGLCQFIQEVRRPNGEKYDPDSILYLCLGIQQVSVSVTYTFDCGFHHLR